MSITKKSAGIFKKGLKGESQETIVIGGMNEEDMSSKKDLLQEMVNEAKVRAETEINAIKQEALKEAALIIKNANNAKQELEDAAYKKGYEAGRIEAIQATNEELAFMLIEAKNILENIQKEREEALHDEEQRIYHVILAIARKLLKRDLELSKEVCLEFINQAIKQLDHKAMVNILCNAEIAIKINELKSTLIESNPGLESLTITADTRLAIGDIILESNKERLDFKLETQFTELARELFKK